MRLGESASMSLRSTRAMRAPWPLAPIDMFPPIKKARPPNIFSSVTSGSSATVHGCGQRDPRRRATQAIIAYGSTDSAISRRLAVGSV